jgi:hypothetical protein
MHPHMLRHTFITTMLDAGVSLREVQIAARHAAPRTTMRYDPARNKPRPAPELHPRRESGAWSNFVDQDVPVMVEEPDDLAGLVVVEGIEALLRARGQVREVVGGGVQ